MSDDLIDALLSGEQCDDDGVMCIVSRQACHEAVARIRELEAERDGLRDALQPFAQIASEPPAKSARKAGKGYIHTVLRVALLDAARAALQTDTGDESDG